MPTVPIPFPLSSAPGKEPAEGAGRLINCFAEPLGEGARAQAVYRRSPGLTSFATPGESTFRGAIEVGSTVYTFWEGTCVTLQYTGSQLPMLIAQAAGTAFGDATGDGDLDAAFDGNADQAVSACATKATATELYIGKTLASTKTINKVEVLGSNDAGYVSGANPDVTITLMAKQGAAPADADDGTVLGTLTFQDTADESGNTRTVSSDDTSTLWAHVWVKIEQEGSAATMSVAEVTFYESTLVPFATLDSMSGSDKLFLARNNASTPNVVIVGGAGAFHIDSGSITGYPDGDVGSPTCVWEFDGYFMFGYGNGDIVASSLNGTAIDTNDKARAESSPDGIIRGWSFNGQSYSAGEESIEIHGYPVNDTGFPLNRAGVINPGLAGKFAVAGFEPWFGLYPIYVASDNTVRRLVDGVTPEKISPPDLDNALEAVTDKTTLEACVYVSGGHAFWQISWPTGSWVFNLNNEKWHERGSYQLARSRITQAFRAFNKWLTGETQSGIIYEIARTEEKEGTAPLVVQLDSGAVTAFPAELSCDRADFDFQMGVGIATGVDPIETDPTVEISYSKDGGHFWSNPRFHKLGRQGKTQRRVSLYRLGQSGAQGWRWRIRISDPVHVGFLGATMTAEGTRVGSH